MAAESLASKFWDNLSDNKQWEQAISECRVGEAAFRVQRKAIMHFGSVTTNPELNVDVNVKTEKECRLVAQGLSRGSGPFKVSYEVPERSCDECFECNIKVTLRE